MSDQNSSCNAQAQVDQFDYVSTCLWPLAPLNETLSLSACIAKASVAFDTVTRRRCRGLLWLEVPCCHALEGVMGRWQVWLRAVIHPES